MELFLKFLQLSLTFIKNKLMKKLFFITLILSGAAVLQNCKSTKTAQAAKAPVQNATVSYERDILPIIQASCTPCHASPTGKVVHLDNYENASREINEIIKLVSLPQDAPNFMPFKNKKPALTAIQINLLKKWRDENMAK